MSEPIAISREVYLQHNGWAETRRGWVKQGGFGSPLPLDSAYQIQTILDDIDNEIEFNPDYVSDTPRVDRLGRPLRTIEQAKLRAILNKPLCAMCEDEGVVEDGEGNERRCSCQEDDDT